MLQHSVVLMMVVTLLVCGETAADGLSRNKLSEELSRAEMRLQGLRSLQEMTRDYVWLDDTWIVAFRVIGARGQSAYSTFYNRDAGNGPVERMCGDLNYRNISSLQSFILHLLIVLLLSLHYVCTRATA